MSVLCGRKVMLDELVFINLSNVSCVWLKALIGYESGVQEGLVISPGKGGKTLTVCSFMIARLFKLIVPARNAGA
jgi:hypothetical protein